jgi:hypothetical protein
MLAAIAALQDFTVAQVTAYCAADDLAVIDALTSAGAEGLVERVRRDEPAADPDHDTEPGRQRWRVVDPRGLRKLAARAAGAPEPHARVDHRDADDDLAQLRLLRAEETLVECADEQSPQERSLMAATAMDYLRQYVAAGAHRRDWWDVEPGVVAADSRVRVDAALASLTESEAEGESVSAEYLLHAASDVRKLTRAMDKPRVRELVDRFVVLADVLSRRSKDPSRGCPAPARLLSAVGWRRVRARVAPDVQRASDEVVALLSWMNARHGTTHCLAPELFRFLGHLPDGRNRIAVFSDLLTIVPCQYRLEQENELVPGVLVQAVADSTATSHLERCASALETGLVAAPYGSDSALVGLVNQVFLDLAAEGAELDQGVLPRSVAARRELLSLFDVHAGTAGYEGRPA